MADLNTLRLFAVIARHRSFRRAATELGLSPSTLSDRMQLLEVQLGVRLLNRTTHSVAPTEAGQALLAEITPALAEIDHAIATTGATRAVPVGTLRINGPRPAVDFVLAPKIAAFLAINPGMRAEIVASDGFIDIVAEGFDAGVRYGESLDQDMIAVSLGGQQRFLVVGSLRYLADCGTSEHPDELASHRRLAHRFKTSNMPD